MIEFLEPNRSKLKLTITIFFLFLSFYIFQNLTQHFLKKSSGKEFKELITKEKYQDLNQVVENMNKKIYEGNELSSLHIKYVVIGATMSISFTVFISYLGACIIFKQWELKNPQPVKHSPCEK